MKKMCFVFKGEIKIFVNHKSPLANNLISQKNVSKKEKKYPQLGNVKNAIMFNCTHW